MPFPPALALLLALTALGSASLARAEEAYLVDEPEPLGASAAEPSEWPGVAQACTVEQRHPDHWLTAAGCDDFERVLGPHRAPASLPDVWRRLPAPEGTALFRAPGALASARGTNRTPQSPLRGADFTVRAIDVPATFDLVGPSLRVDANARVRPDGADRVDLSVKAKARYEIDVGSPLRLAADASATRLRADRVSLQASAAAEYEPAPPLKLRGETVFEDPRPRVVVGARLSLVPDRLGLDFSANRRTGTGLDLEPWSWQAGLRLRAPFLD